MRHVRPPIDPPICEHTADDGPLQCGAHTAKTMTNDYEHRHLHPEDADLDDGLTGDDCATLIQSD